jgi:hypothetical protein
VSTLRAARTGIRGDNDIVWVGPAANRAAKLCAKPEKPIWITSAVFDSMDNSTKYAYGNGALMWNSDWWHDGTSLLQVYSSTYRWSID